MLHFITLSSDAPAASRQRFICSSTSSVWRSIGTESISPVRSNGGSPETKIMLPARVTGDAGAPHFSSQEEIGSTRTTSRFMALPWFDLSSDAALVPLHSDYDSLEVGG